MGSVSGVGLGLRREMVNDFCTEGVPDGIDFLEVAPENWMRVNPRLARQFRELTERHPFVCHGLSLSIGAPAPLDLDFVRQLKAFLDAHQIEVYSEHLSYCSGNAHLYDLMPIPFTEEAVAHVAERVRVVQSILERPLVLENVSYYAAPGARMDELTFINAVLQQADCELLLDVNNIYVNSVNHRYDARTFLAGLPTDRIRYLHLAGHYQEAPDLIVDTHGAAVVDPVWQLLEEAYAIHGVHPTLLERDFNLPPMAELMTELEGIAAHQLAAAERRASA
ncbi:DUF692 domain-containing protein [Ferrimonas balearica]|uniref:HvfB family MNIO-type RiPP peptide maturase n=1 Tax=Ferrimonas balearica TaxID=44012 RepID=UPI001C5A1E41|nr:DUF692 domain-containing protein [Ferrimonas balearica]MBW3164151.1 DUF692 domain-containing protein [Ferrimonas balearica]MBY6224126.1 DUF692 domain-containing protein [Ferrimonas balearica]